MSRRAGWWVFGVAAALVLAAAVLVSMGIWAHADVIKAVRAGVVEFPTRAEVLVEWALWLSGAGTVAALVAGVTTRRAAVVVVLSLGLLALGVTVRVDAELSDYRVHGVHGPHPDPR
ncbi:hypothetical protein [Actinokineospora sp. HUAS TT18]|uniref:hypothetical protein n=1 Tax=Actinokineospora sp. HUAS TT18 TaxID=3447451 RepID=UPI003F51DBCA